MLAGSSPLARLGASPRSARRLPLTPVLCSACGLPRRGAAPGPLPSRPLSAPLRRHRLSGSVGVLLHQVARCWTSSTSPSARASASPRPTRSRSSFRHAKAEDPSDAWAESQRIDTVKHAKIHGLVGYEMLRRKDEQKAQKMVPRDGHAGRVVDARELIEPMAILGVARDRAAVERLANAINEGCRPTRPEHGRKVPRLRHHERAAPASPRSGGEGLERPARRRDADPAARRRQMLDRSWVPVPTSPGANSSTS